MSGKTSALQDDEVLTKGKDKTTDGNVLAKDADTGGTKTADSKNTNYFKALGTRPKANTTRPPLLRADARFFARPKPTSVQIGGQRNDPQQGGNVAPQQPEADPKKAERELENATYETLYRGYKQFAEKFRNDFARFPEIYKDLIRELEVKLADAKAIADTKDPVLPPDYKAASNVLEAMPLFGKEGIEARGKKLFEAAAKNLEKSMKSGNAFHPVVTRCKTMRADIEKAPLAFDTVTSLTNDLNLIMQKVVATKTPGDRDVKERTQETDTLQARVEFELVAATIDRDKYTNLRKRAPEDRLVQLEQAIGKLDRYDIAAHEVLKDRLKQADELAAAKEFATAAQEVELFTEEVTKWLSELSVQGAPTQTAPVDDDDDDVDPSGDAGKIKSILSNDGVAKLVSDITVFGKENKVTAPESAKTLMQELVGRLANPVAFEKSFNEGMTIDDKALAGVWKSYSEANAEFDALRIESRQWMKLAEHKEAEQDKFAKVFDPISDQLEAVLHEIGSMTVPGISGLVAELMTTYRDWNAVFDGARTIDEFDKGVARIKSSFQDIAKRALALVKDGEQIGKLKDEAALEKEREAVAERAEMLETLAGELAGKGTGTAAIDMFEEAQKARAVAAGNDLKLIRKARTDLDQRIKNLEGASDAAVKQKAEAKTNIEKNCAAALKIIESTEAAANKVDNKSRGNVAAIVKDLRQRHDELVLLAGAQSWPVLQEADLAAAELLDDAEQVDPGTDSRPKKAKQALKPLLEKLDTLANRLAALQPDAKDYAALSTAKIQERIQKLQKSPATGGLRGLQEALTALEDDVTKLGEKAATAKARFEPNGDFVKAVEPVRKILDGTDLDAAPAYKAKVEKELQGIEVRAKYEGQYKKAKDELAALEKRLGDEKANNGLAAQEATAQADLADKEKDRLRYEAAVKILDLKLKRKEVKDQVPKAERKSLKKRFDDACKLAEKSKEYGPALDAFEDIGNRIDLVLANPTGLAMTGRDKLSQVNQEFLTAARLFRLEMTKLQKKFKAMADNADLDKEQLKQLTRDVRTTVGLLRLTALKPVIATMEDKEKKGKKERAAAQTKGLRIVRRMIRAVEHDYHMKALARMPQDLMDKNMRSLLSRVKLSLVNLENNLLVSL